MAIFAAASCAWLGTATPAQAAITSISVGAQSAAEGQPFSGPVATFTTNDPFDTFAYVIDWGDGTTDGAPATITGDNGTVSGSHTYAEDGTYTLTVTVTEAGGSPDMKAASAAFTVAETDLSVVAVPPITVSEGNAFAGPVAFVIDSGSPDPASSYAATIDWGDGASTIGTISGSAGDFTVSASHTYTDELPDGVITVTVSELGVADARVSVQDRIDVTDADALTARPLTFTTADGVPFSGTVATFADTATTTPASGFTATIDWGDGTSTSGTVAWSGGTLDVSGIHTYSSPGSYPVSVGLTDDPPGTAAATATSTAYVTASKPSAMTQGASGVTITAATLNGTVNPNGDATSYSFQYGTTGAYGSTTASASAGSGNSDRAALVSLIGLRPGTTYHYRVVATNSAGTTVGSDQTFTTLALTITVKARRHDSFLVLVTAPAPGTVDVAAVAGTKSFGHARLTATHAGQLKILVRPNRSGRRPLGHPRRHITLRVTVTFTLADGQATTITFRGLRVHA